MGVASACPKPCTHAWTEFRCSVVRPECRCTLNDVYELVLPGMRMAQRRGALRSELREVHSEVRQTEDVAQRVLLPSRHT